MKTAQKNITVNNTDILVLWPENQKRKYLVIQNQSIADIIISFGASPTTIFGYRIASGDEYTPINPPTGEIRVIGTDTVNTQLLYSAEESV